MSDEIVEVAFPFVSADPDQISLNIGEKITVIRKVASGWWIGKDSKGAVGSFPASYTRPVKEKPKFAVPKEQKTAMLQHHGVNATATAAAMVGYTLSGGGGGGGGESAAVTGGTSSRESSLSKNVDGGGGMSSGRSQHGQHQLTTSSSSSHVSLKDNGNPGSGVYRSMPRGDQQQLKHLLGLDDEEDEDGGGGGGHGGAQSPNSPEQRQKAMELFMFQSNRSEGAGNHRSLFDGNARRSSAVGGGGGGMLHSPNNLSVSGGGADGGGAGLRTNSFMTSSLIEQVIALRRELKYEEANSSKIVSKENAMRSSHTVDDKVTTETRQQVDQIKHSIQVHQLSVSDLEKRLEVARCALEGVVPLPTYDPNEYSRLVAALTNNNNNNNGTPSSTCNTPSSSPREAPRSVPTAAPGGELQTNNASVPTQQPSALLLLPPSEEQLDNDPFAKKLVKKLNRRIAEAQNTKLDYEKQSSKMRKRISKYQQSMKQIEEEIALLTSTLHDAAATRPGGADDGGRDDGAPNVTSSTAVSEEEDAGTQQHSRERQMRIADKRFRKLLKTLTEEELADVEQYQLAEIKLQQKCAKLKEQLEGDTAEVTNLKAHIEKLRKRLTKGDDALQVLTTERQELLKRIAAIERGAVDAQESFTKAAAVLKDRERSLRDAMSLRDAAIAKANQDRVDLLRRIEKEQKRNADFSLELARLQAKANDNTTTTAASE